MVERGKSSWFGRKSLKKESMEEMVDQEAEFYNRYLEKEEKKQIEIPKLDEIKQYPKRIYNFFKEEDTEGTRLIVPAEKVKKKKCKYLCLCSWVTEASTTEKCVNLEFGVRGRFS